MYLKQATKQAGRLASCNQKNKQNKILVINFSPLILIPILILMSSSY